MALTSTDFIQLPFDPQYSRAGVQHGCRLLTHTGLHLPHGPAEFLRQTSVDVAFEMALRRWLEQMNVAYALPGVHLSPGRPYALTLGGRRCGLKAIQISGIQPSSLLDNEVVLDLETFGETQLGEKDIYIFGVVMTQPPPKPPDTPTILIHLFAGRRWESRAGQWLSPLHLHFDGTTMPTLYLGGLDANWQAVHGAVTLRSNETTTPPYDLRTLVYIQTDTRPDGPLRVESATRDLHTAITPNQWYDFWLTGQTIVLLGWLNKRDFRAHSRLIRAGAKIAPLGRLTENSRALLVTQLRPMTDLVEIVQKRS